MENNRDIFIQKLDRFIRRYYQNLLIRGSLLFSVIFLFYLFIISFSEYFLFLSIAVRSLIVIISVIGIGFLTYQFLWVPITGLLKIGKRISYRQAIDIVSTYFPEFEDKLLNTLELTEQVSDFNLEKNSLLLASINQRIESIKPISFNGAIKFKANFIYLKYLGFVMGLILSVYFLIPDLYKNSSNRLLHFNTFYAPPADFKFVLDNGSVQVVKGSDFRLKVHTEGKYVPDEIYIVMGNSRFLLKKEKLGKFSYLFRNVNSYLTFQLQSGSVISENYSLKIISKPGVKNLSVSIHSPAYTKLPLRIEKNLVDISVPEGSYLEWTMKTDDLSTGELIFSDSVANGTEILDGNVLKISRNIRKDISYRIYLSNKEFRKVLYAKYNIKVTPDEYPQIAVRTIQDTIRSTGFYFHGQIKDDYGFSKLRFVYQTENRNAVYIPISIKNGISSQEFFFSYDFASDNLKEGSNVKYHFEVFDNDGINGAKKTSSQFFTYYSPDANQRFDLNAVVQDSIHDKFAKGIRLSDSIKKDILRLQTNNLDGSAEKWQQQQLLREIDGKKKQLDELLKNISEENRKRNQMLNSSGFDDPELLSKQKQLEDLMQKLMNPELEKLFEEFNKLAKDLKSDDLNKLGNQLKMSVGDFRKQMDRNLQLLERYEIEVQIKQLVERIDKLAEQQKKDAELLRKQPNELKIQQQLGKEKWNDLEQDLSDVLEKNKHIKKPYQFDIDIPQLRNEIQKLLNDIGNLLENSKLGKAIKSIRTTSYLQHKLARKLADSINNSQMMQLSVDIENLVRLLNNLIEFSFQQEEVIGQFKRLNYRNPEYVVLIERQGELKDEYQLIQDSLLSLSEHSPQVASLIGNRIYSIKDKLRRVLEEANIRRKVQASIVQQQILTDINELSVFLSEALNQMMEQMSNAMPGNQLGEKKNGKASFAGLKSQQESIKKMLEDIISEMKNGQGKMGSKSKLGKLLQKQEMYRNSLGKMLQNSELSNESNKILHEIMRMVDQMESDISNFSINSTIINRQNRIISRLLEAENAQKEKDFDKKRESKSGNVLNLSNPREIFEYKRVRTDFDGVFYNSNLKMFDYYNKLYLDYMIKLNND